MTRERSSLQMRVLFACSIQIRPDAQSLARKHSPPGPTALELESQADTSASMASVLASPTARAREIPVAR